MYVELLVGNESGTKVYQPVVQEGIEWSTERKNTPGKLVFKVLYDNILDFSEGSPVRMKVDGDNVFFGFVFKQQRSKDKIITVTAYDQLTYDNEDTKKRDVYITQDSSNINKWGILQYFDTLQKGENGQAKADALLKLYNKKTRNLKITNALGDNRVRAGSMVVINLDLGDMKVKNWMLVEKCKHTYKEGEHWMDLTLRGGEFIA